ncbi:MAG: AbrB/MazE/SpoVT family DNA-binding domain-containing protein [Candidatus Hadarchaeales archaeon]
MATETKISKGYQTVVPSELRKAHEIAPGDRLIWEEKRGEIRVRVKKRKTWADITGMINVGGDAVDWKKRAQRGEL